MDTQTRDEILEQNRHAADCRQKGDIPEAIVHLQLALDLVPDNEVIIRAKLLSALGMLQAEANDFGTAIQSFHKARGLFQDEGDIVAIAIQNGNIGSVYRDTGDVDRALTHYKEALELLLRCDFEPAIADQHANIAYAYAQQQERSYAVDHFTRARTLYEKNGQQERAEMCTHNIDLLTT